ncbi:pentapeptide repeat-containing protein [Streptomyces narbonensis]|uniref:Pentapeptide repeat-containing protein n=2 Tax=Streptomyces venezuelae TaxID=54571 RepID=A0A5P2AS40_STRVZ|nr:pentapeptide repeat-containing protein [Streptomyces venezuelae]QES23489.1 pentapeptide repeat-containing protein [Streptomyces venezuelae]
MRLRTRLRGRLQRRPRQSHRSPVTMAVVLGVPAALGLVLLLLGPLTWVIAGDSVRNLDGKEQVDALNATRQTVLAATGGIVLALGLAYTAQTYHLSQRGQVTQRFSTGVTQLSSEKLEERLGGVFALEHIAAESPQEHLTVITTLATYVREHTRRSGRSYPSPPDTTEDWESLLPEWGTELPSDIQAAMEVLARRPERTEPRRIDLRHTNLSGLMMREFEFESRPRLTRMFLTWCDLRRADMRGVDLRGSILNTSDLSAAWLDRAQLAGVQFSSARLCGARLGGADILGADFCLADLRDVSGLTAAQLSGAVIDEATKLPEELERDPWVIARRSFCRTWRETHGAFSTPPPTPAPAGC